MDEVKMAIENIILKRLRNGATETELRNYLEHLKKDVWGNDLKLQCFINGLIYNYDL